MKEYVERNVCAVCDNSNLQKVLDLNKVPLAGYFPTKSQLNDKSSYPLKLLFCDDYSKIIDTYHLLDYQIILKNWLKF